MTVSRARNRVACFRRWIVAASAPALMLSNNLMAAEGLDDAFLQGKTRLEYKFFSTKGATGGAELRRLYDEGRWVELVREVTAKHFVVDTYYFYLGRAAEALDAPAAAETYYKLSQEASQRAMTKCTVGGVWNTCADLDVESLARKRIGAMRLTNKKITRWEPGQGPKLEELVGLKPTPVKDLALQTSVQAASDRPMSRFETEEEYKSRTSSSNERSVLLVKRVGTSEAGGCKTDYDRANKLYTAKGCWALDDVVPFTEEKTIGPPMQLANMVDKREVERRVQVKYLVDANLEWNEAYKLEPAAAIALDEGLMAAVVVQGVEVSKNYIEETFPGWEKKAFLSGYIDSHLKYKIKPKKISRFVVFSNVDSRVLYDMEILN